MLPSRYFTDFNLGALYLSGLLNSNLDIGTDEALLELMTHQDLSKYRFNPLAGNVVNLTPERRLNPWTSPSVI